MRYKLIDTLLTKDIVNFYKSLHKGFTVNKHKLLEVYFDDGSSSTYLIFKGKFTKQYMCRECEDFYELSTGNGIIKIYKDDII